MQTRKAASVFPEPVGAEISVSPPAAIAGHPLACGSVGPAGKRVENHSRTTGWKPASTSLSIMVCKESLSLVDSGTFPANLKLPHRQLSRARAMTGGPLDDQPPAHQPDGDRATDPEHGREIDHMPERARVDEACSQHPEQGR